MQAGLSLTDQQGASPRGRSSLVVAEVVARDAGRISARAEQPEAGHLRPPGRPAHLRAGGAANGAVLGEGDPGGASPRGRSSPPHEGRGG